MAVRKDSVQIDIAFITDESKKFAKLLTDTKQFEKDLRAARKAGKGVDDVINDMVKAGKSLRNIDLNRLAPAQLVTRARQLARLVGRNGIIPQSAQQYKELSEEYARINTHLREMQQRSRGVTDAQRRMGQSGFNAGKLIARGLALFSFAQIGRDIVTTTAKFEKFEAVLSNALGSQSAAKKAFELIQEFAANTPFQVDEITESFVKLVNRGFQPTRDELENIGDLAASQGKSFDQLVEAILDAQTGEFERLKEFGIRASKAGDQVTLSFKGQEVAVKNTEEAIRSAVLAFGDLEGVQGTTAQIAETLEGKLSNFQDRITSLLNTLGSGGTQDAIKTTIALLDDLAAAGIRALESTAQRAKRLSDEFLEQTKAVADLEKEYNPLLERYDELSQKNNRSTEEQAELEEIIKKVAERVPTAITQFDDYGRALEISSGKARNFIDSQRQIVQTLAAQGEESAKTRIEQVKNTIALIQEELATGIVKGATGFGELDDLIFGKNLTPEQILQRQASLAEYRKELETYENVLSEIKRVNDGGPVFDFIGNAERGNENRQPTILEKQRQELDRNLQKAKELNQEIQRIPLAEFEQIENIDSNPEDIQNSEEVLREVRKNEFLKQLNEERNKDLEAAETQRLANLERSLQLEEKLRQLQTSLARNALTIGIQLLSKDQEARKKYAGAIKALEIFKIGVNLQAEIQGIYKNANSNALNILIPGWGITYGKAQEIFAIARAGLAARRIASAKFAGGGFTGPGSYRDSTGHRVAGVVHENEYVAPTWQIEKYPGLFANLEADRLKGYNDGGFVGVNTTPNIPSFTQNITQNADVDLSEVVRELRMLRTQQRNQPPVRAYVSLDELNTAQTELNNVEGEAAL